MFSGVMGGVARWRWGAPPAAQVIWSVAALFTLVYFVVPAWRRAMYLGWVYATYPIGWVVSHLVVIMVYYGVFTPIGLVMRLGGRDALHRRLEPSASTYWVERRGVDDRKRYFRQF